MLPQNAYKRRTTLRLPGYDYTQAGAYFVTMCTYGQECILGHVSDETMILNQLGQIVDEEWMRSGELRAEIDVDVHVIMPNHLHGIVVINPEDHMVKKARLRKEHHDLSGSSQKSGLMKKSLGSFIAGFKSAVTKRSKALSEKSQKSVWQRNYYDHIIRNDDDLVRVREYIINNPAHWHKDRFHPVFGS